MATGAATLPRLLYIGDVPIENSYHGSSLLYRLLLNYPPERLMIVETGPIASIEERRLSSVAYRHVAQPLARLLRTRFSRIAGGLALGTARWRHRQIAAAIAGFETDALLTVSHGEGWLAAVEIAARRNVPHHLICHDEWARLVTTWPALTTWKNAVFGKAYRSATSRLCVSPEMVDDYAQRYDVVGTTLYPARSHAAPVYQGLSPRLAAERNGRTFAFAGSMNSARMADANIRLADALAPLGGKLLIYGPTTTKTHPSLDRPNVEMRGLLTPNALSDALRGEADALFLPMWFDDGHDDNLRLCFPSKLTDYTSVGLPILINAPEFSSGVAWERRFPGVAAVVTSTDATALAQAAARILEDRAWASSLAARAKAVGDALFDPHHAEAIFFAALRAA